MNKKLLEKLKQTGLMEKIVDCSNKEEIKKINNEEINNQINKIPFTISKIDEEDMENISGGIGEIRDTLAHLIDNIGYGIYRFNNNTNEKAIEDYNFKDKIIDNFQLFTLKHSEDIANVTLGAVIITGWVMLGRFVCKKLGNKKDWWKNNTISKN